MTGNMRIMGRCYDGQVTKPAQGHTNTGVPYAGTYRSTCEKCSGRGCGTDGATALAKVADELTDAQKLELAEAVQRIVNPAAGA